MCLSARQIAIKVFCIGNGDGIPRQPTVCAEEERRIKLVNNDRREIQVAGMLQGAALAGLMGLGSLAAIPLQPSASTLLEHCNSSPGESRYFRAVILITMNEQHNYLTVHPFGLCLIVKSLRRHNSLGFCVSQNAAHYRFS